MRAVRFLLVAGALTALAVVVGVVALGGGDGDGSDPRPTEQPFTTTELADYDTAGAVVTRGPFCERIDERQVDAALGSVPDVQQWAAGDRVDLSGGGRPDVVHEFGCAYAVQDVGAARAWVFAPPVDQAGAERLAKQAAKAKGCVAGTGPAFGSPTLALTCTAADGTVRASYRGLFGDAWLVCEVELPPASPQAGTAADVAGRWCVGVLEAAAG